MCLSDGHKNSFQLSWLGYSNRLTSLETHEPLKYCVVTNFNKDQDTHALQHSNITEVLLGVHGVRYKSVVSLWHECDVSKDDDASCNEY